MSIIPWGRITEGIVMRNARGATNAPNTMALNLDCETI